MGDKALLETIFLENLPNYGFSKPKETAILFRYNGESAVKKIKI